MLCYPMPNLLGFSMPNIDAQLPSQKLFVVQISENNWPESPDQIPPLRTRQSYSPQQQQLDQQQLDQQQLDQQQLNQQQLDQQQLDQQQLDQQQLDKQQLVQQQLMFQEQQRQILQHQIQRHSELKKMYKGIRQRKPVELVNSYERKRMTKLINMIEGFEPVKSMPYIWMVKNFGRIITQKEFNEIYGQLKDLLPADKAPNRDVNRNQKLRFKWMAEIWSSRNARSVVQNLVGGEMSKK